MGRPEKDIGTLEGRLLLERMSGMLERGQGLDKCREVLGRKDAWGALGREERLTWARLAQAAGILEVSLEVLESINRDWPDAAEAWEDRVALLSLMGRDQESLETARAAYEKTGEQPGAGPGAQERGEDVEAAVVPFSRHRRRLRLLERFLGLFSGREDCFARQWADKGERRQGYVPVRRPMTLEDVEEHLKGAKTYGIYLLRSDATVKAAVIDVDLAGDYRKPRLSREERGRIRREGLYVVSRVREVSKEKSMPPLVEFSGGKGFHFWFFFEPPVEAGRAKRTLERVVAEVRGDVASFEFEVFPKQEALSGKGLGNLVKLPLGIHRLTGKRSRFLDCAERELEAQLSFLDKVCPIGPSGFREAEEKAAETKVVVHPRMREWAEAHPELLELERKCPPLGQVIAACREGKALALREEKVLFQTVGFLQKAKTLLHELFGRVPEYNPHLVDYKLSRLRGKPLGCKRIHRLLNFDGEYCSFDGGVDYGHPLLHLGEWRDEPQGRAEKAQNLEAALENLKLAISQVQRFMR